MIVTVLYWIGISSKIDPSAYDGSNLYMQII